MSGSCEAKPWQKSNKKLLHTTIYDLLLLVFIAKSPFPHKSSVSSSVVKIELEFSDKTFQLCIY